MTADATELQARTRARRRLVGAAVLLVSGVIAFPLLFETQPRPVPVDIPMVIPSREGAAPLTPPARPSRTDSGTIAPAAGSVPPAPAPASAGASSAAAPAAAAVTAAAAPTPVPAPAPADSVAHAKAIERMPEKPAEKPAEKPPAKAAAAPAEKTAAAPVAKPPAPPVKAEPKAEPKVEPKKPEPKKPEPAAEAKGVRYVVQVGAYADEASTRDVRQRVDKLGLKTYTQTVEVQGATRIRVRIGPFDSVQEANKALATLKAAKLPGAVLTL